MIFRVTLLLIVSYFANCPYTASQANECNFSIRGQVLDITSHEPLIGATILINELNRGTATAIDGSFELSGLCAKEFDITVSFVGYQTIRHHHDYHHEDIEVFLAPESEMLEGIIVEGGNSTGQMQTSAISSLSIDQLELSKSESLGDAMSQIAGISMVRSGQNIVSPMIHGLSGNRILIINDDVRHEYQNWDSDHAPEIDLSQVSKIQVIKGAGTVRYGPDALGGVVLLENEEVELSSPWKANLDFIGKSNGRSFESGLSIEKGYKWMTLSSFGSWLKQGDLKAPNYHLTNTGKREISGGESLRFHLNSEIDFFVSYSHFDQELGVLRGSVNSNLEDLQAAIESEEPSHTTDFSYEIAPPKQRVVHEVLKMELRFIDDKQSGSIRYSLQNNHRREFDIRRGNELEVPNINVELTAHVIDADWSHPQIGPFRGKLGLQYIHRDNTNQAGTNTVPFIPNYASRSIGFYWTESIENDIETFELGARMDRYEAVVLGREPDNSLYRSRIDFTNVSGVIGYKRNLSEQWQVSSHLGTAWRPPNIGELYRFGRRGSFIEYGLWRYDFDSSSELSTDRILMAEDREVNSEIGIKWINTLSHSSKSWNGEINFYTNWIKNYIYSRPAGLSNTVRGSAPVFIYDQQDALFIGTDLSIRVQHSEVLTSQFGAGLLYADQLDRDGSFAGIPPPRMDYALAVKPDMAGLNLSAFRLAFSYTFQSQFGPRVISVSDLLQADALGLDLFSEMAEDFDLIDPPPAFLLADISWSASKGRLKWAIQVNNLFNQSYRHYTDRMRYFADDIGRNISISIGLQL